MKHLSFNRGGSAILPVTSTCEVSDLEDESLTTTTHSDVAEVKVETFSKNLWLLNFKSQARQDQFLKFVRNRFENDNSPKIIWPVVIMNVLSAIKFVLIDQTMKPIIRDQLFIHLVAVIIAMLSLLFIAVYFVLNFSKPNGFVTRLFGNKFTVAKIYLLYLWLLTMIVSIGFTIVGKAMGPKCDGDTAFFLCSDKTGLPDILNSLYLVLAMLLTSLMLKGLVPFYMIFLGVLTYGFIIWGLFLEQDFTPPAELLLSFCVPGTLVFYLCRGICLQDMITFEYHCALKKSMEDQLKDHREQAKVENTQLKMVLANVAHDLKTPLQAFSAGMFSLKSTVTLVPDAISILHDMDASYAFMTMQINRALDVSKTDNKMDLIPKSESFLLGEIVSWAVKIMSSIQSRIRVGIDEASSKLILSKFILTDKVWLQENMLCLLSNACKYSPEDSSVSIMVKHIEATSGTTISNNTDTTETDSLLIEVRDEGVGVSDEMRAKLFKPFAQAQRRAGGTGLGLYSLALRVQALGGDFGIRSPDESEGSTFFFSIPVTVDTSTLSVAEECSPLILPKFCPVVVSQHSANDTVSTKFSNSNISTSRSQGCRDNANGEEFKVLVVDDSVLSLKLLSRAIKQATSAEVDMATDGFSALKLMKKTKYTAVIMDIQMPIMVSLCVYTIHVTLCLLCFLLHLHYIYDIVLTLLIYIYFFTY
jgi:signal transduction histidine kinase